MACSVVDLEKGQGNIMGQRGDELTLSSFLHALRHTHSSSSSRNSDLSGSLHIGHEIGLASSPGGTTTY